MHMIKKENGITMTMLVITIIVLGIISTIVIRYSINGLEYTHDKKLLIELENVQHAVVEQYELYKNTGNENFLLKSGTADDGTVNQMRLDVNNSPNAQIKSKNNIQVTDQTPIEQKYYYITNTQLEEMGLKEVTNKYIVNYATGECYNVTVKYTSDGKTLLYID